MVKGYGQAQYLKTQVTTVDGGKLIVLLYEGAIKFLRKAQESIETKDIKQRHNSIVRALNIIDELRNSLNFSQGGEIAKNLQALYLFMNRHLTLANAKNDPKMIQEVINLLASLKEAWETILTKPEVIKSSAKSSAPTGIRI
jgi:flagellar protein FliS